MQQRRGARPRNCRQAAARAPSRGGAFFEAVRRGRSRSPLLAARPAPSELQSRNRERPRGLSVIALARVPHPPAASPQGHPRNDKQEWLVSAPGLHHPVRRPGALPPPPGPRLAEYACSRERACSAYRRVEPPPILHCNIGVTPKTSKIGVPRPLHDHFLLNRGGFYGFFGASPRWGACDGEKPL